MSLPEFQRLARQVVYESIQGIGNPANSTPAFPKASNAKLINETQRAGFAERTGCDSHPYCPVLAKRDACVWG